MIDSHIKGEVQNHLKTYFVYNVMTWKDKEQEKEYRKKYQEERREEINARRRLNPNKKEYNRKYREEHWDELNKKCLCPCGGSYTQKHKARHMKSQKHAKYLENL